MSRQDLVIFALGMLAAAGAVVFLGSLVLLWREARDRRRGGRDRSG